jgi:hypothetical protein
MAALVGGFERVEGLVPFSCTLHGRNRTRLLLSCLQTPWLALVLTQTKCTEFPYSSG